MCCIIFFMKSIAFVTYKKFPELSESDILLVEWFKKIEYEAVSTPWDDPQIDWKKFDYVIIRSCWDYHERIDEFYLWLDLLEKLHVKVFNPLPIIRWNSNKKYLLDLEKKDIPIVPTRILKIYSHVSVKDLFNNNIYQEIVVKPVFGASAYKVISIKQNNLEEGQKQVDRLLSKTDVLVQPLMREVMNDGEYSFMFFNKKYSHAMIKRPKNGGFITNYHLGGTESPIIPSLSLTEQAKKIIEKIDSPLLYARVDGIDCNGILTLMELELIEPHLFLDQDEDSPKRFVQALLKLVT